MPNDFTTVVECNMKQKLNFFMTHGKSKGVKDPVGHNINNSNAEPMQEQSNK